MKKKLLIGTIGATLIFGGAFAVGAMGNDDSRLSNKQVEVTNAKTRLTVEAAEKIALKEVKGVIDSIELEKESGREVYDVDVVKDGREFDIHIDAYTGEVYSVDSDDDHDDDRYDDKYDDKNDDSDDDSKKASTNNTNVTAKAEANATPEKKVNSVKQDDDRNDDKDDDRNDDKDDDRYDDKNDDKNITSNNNSNIISLKEAVAIAEKRVNGKMVEVELDEDDGYRLYEVELKTDKGKAEVDIDATNGAVLKVEWDD